MTAASSEDRRMAAPLKELSSRTIYLTRIKPVRYLKFVHFKNPVVCVILISFKIVVIFNITSADFVLIQLMLF